MIRLATMSSVCPDWTLDETIAAMKKYGYEGYEPRVEWGHQGGVEKGLSAKERAAVRKRFADEGLRVACIATGCRFAMAEAEERARQAALLKEYIDLAGDLGAPAVRVFGGKIPGGELRGVVRYLAEALRPALDRARERGVTVCMETHDDWCRSPQVHAVIRELKHPSLGVLWDIMHTQRFLETPQASFECFGTHVRHLHVHDGRYTPDGLKMETVALSQGEVDHAGPLKLLQAAGAELFASVEVIHKPGQNGPADAVLKNYAEGLKQILGK